MYTLADTFIQGFEENGCEVYHYNYLEDVISINQRIHGHIGKLPYRIRSKWYKYYVGKVNEKHLDHFRCYDPDIVLVYNSELLLPETVKIMKRSAKVCFFMGDSPFYTPQNDFFFPCLMQADHIFCPDSYWEKQLRGMGISNVHFFLIGSNPKVNFKKRVTLAEQGKWGSDLVFVGVSYMTPVGFKRALFLNQFSSQNFRIYTSSKFQRWIPQFPDLRDKVVYPEKRLTDYEVNTILNCCKIYPVDANPGLLNGIHLRIFDCIASGIMPLAEYRKDLKSIFGRFGMPIIENYRNGASMAKYYLAHEKERLDIISCLREEVQRSYSPRAVIENVLEKVWV